MSYTLTITDDTVAVSYTLLELPFVKRRETGTSDVTVLNGNIYTDYIYKKFKIEHTWAVMTADEYRTLEGFYNRQFSLHKYPRITILDLGIENAVCKLDLGEQSIINNCGLVEKVKITLRESDQL